MNLRKWVQHSSNVFGENLLLKFVVALWGAALVFIGFRVERAVNMQRTIIMPPGLTQKVEVGSGDASDEYIEHYARYALNLALNYTPGTVRGQFDRLLLLYAPESYPQAQTALYELASAIEKARNTNAFYVTSIVVFRDKEEVEIAGVRRQFIEDVKAGEQRKTYVMKYRIINGQMQIVELAEKPEGGRQ